VLPKLSAINFENVRRRFPMLVHGFGASVLKRQVDAYNEVVAAGHASPVHINFLLQTQKQIRSPHLPLLNTLSVWHSPDLSRPSYRAMVARVFLLEQLLRGAATAGEKPSGYEDMLREPNSLDRVIGELDAGSPLTRVGRFSAHQLTDPTGTSKKNYDIDWQWLGCHLRADVKWFDTWVLKP
jgi:hypothetical protein